MFCFLKSDLTGNVVLDLDAEYHKGENLDGVLSLSMNRGELIPASTRVIFEAAGEQREFVLEDILSEESVDGVYYVEGMEILGSGTGYGLAGERKIYPEISFDFVVSSEGDSSGGSGDIGEIEVDEEPEVVVDEDEIIEEPEVMEDVEAEEVVMEAEEEVAEEPEVVVDEEEIIEEPEVVEEVEDESSESEVVSILTGNVVLGLEEDFSGSVSGNESFTYDLQEGQSARLVPGSVTVDSEIINDDEIDFRVVDGRVLVSSDYFETEEGFGSDYLNDEVWVLEIDLSSVGLNFSEGVLDISFVYGEEEIVSLSTVLREGVVNEVSEEVTKEVVEEVLETSLLTLEENEKAIIVEKFGDAFVKTTRSEVVGGRLILNYKIGGYELVSSYNYDESDAVFIEEQIKRDRINFLKDLARMISREDVVGEEKIEFVRTFEF